MIKHMLQLASMKMDRVAITCGAGWFRGGQQLSPVRREAGDRYVLRTLVGELLLMSSQWKVVQSRLTAVLPRARTSAVFQPICNASVASSCRFCAQLLCIFYVGRILETTRDKTK